MTPALDTAEGRRLLEKATPGPWSEVHGKHASFIRTLRYSSGEVARCDRWRDEAYGPTEEQSKANAALIVYAVNNLPALLSAVAALERERDEAVKAERERMAGQLGEGPHSGVTAPDGVDCYYFDTANGCIVIWHGKAYAVDNEGDVDFTKLATLREPSDG